MAHIEPLTEQVDFFLSMLTGLVESADEMGQAKALHRVVEKGVQDGTVKAATLARYAETEEVAKAGVLAYWEHIRHWMGQHLPPSTPCSHPYHDHG